MKNKQLKNEQLLNQTISPEKPEVKAIKISVLCCLPVEKFTSSSVFHTSLSLSSDQRNDETSDSRQGNLM